MTNRIETAEKIAEATNGRVWAPKGEDGIIRVYAGKKGYCQIENDGVNIDCVNRNLFEETKAAVEALNLKTYRA